MVCVIPYKLKYVNPRSESTYIYQVIRLNFPINKYSSGLIINQKRMIC